MNFLQVFGSFENVIIDTILNLNSIIIEVDLYKI